MNLKDFVYGLFILIIPLILILLLHRLYIANKCHNNKECIKKKMVIDIDNVTNKLVTNLNFIKNNDIKNNIVNNNAVNDNKEEEIEEFFGGLADWAYNQVSPTNSLHPPQDSINAANNENNNIVPQLNSKMSTDTVPDASNTELLNSIHKKNGLIKNLTNKKIDSPNTLKDMNNVLKQEISKTKKSIQQFTPEIIDDEQILKNQENPSVPSNINTNINRNTNTNTNTNDKTQLTKPNPTPAISKLKPSIIKPKASSLFNECNFYPDKCPSGYNNFGSIGLTGNGQGQNSLMMSCGNVEKTKPAKAIAKIKDSSLEEIIIIDKGHGFNPTKPPKVTVIGGKGNGALCESVIDDDGFLTLIKIIHPGNFYTETPNIIIDPPLMNSNCHFCCK